MIGSFRASWLKLRKRPAVWILGSLLVALLVLLTYVLSYLIFNNPPKGANFGSTDPRSLKVILYPTNYVRTTLSAFSGLGAAIALILGVLSYGSEYGWGTLKTVFTQRPGRLATLAGNLLALGAVIAIMVAALFAAGAVCSSVIGSLDGRGGDWPAATTILKGAAAAWLIMAMWAAFGVVLSILFRQSALAIGIGLLYSLVIESIVFGLFGQVDWLKTIEKGFPGANANSLVASFGSGLRRGAAGASPDPLVGGTQAALVVLLFLVVFLVISAGLLRARDVT